MKAKESDGNVHIVRNSDVRGPPSKLPGIDRQHTNIEPAVPRPLKQADRLHCIHNPQQMQEVSNMLANLKIEENRTHDLVIMPHIKLEEPRSLCRPSVRSSIMVHAVALVLDRGAGVVSGRDSFDGLGASGGEAVLRTPTRQ